MKNSEVWVPVLGWEEHYAVSDAGRLKCFASKLRPNRHPEKVLKPSPNNGYLTVLFCRGGKKFKTHISRVVLGSFSGEYRKGMQAAHINGKRSDNRLENLYWATVSENLMDKHKHGTARIGKDSPRYVHGRYCKYMKSGEEK